MSYSSKNPKISTTILTDQTTSSVSAAPSSSHRLINRSGNLWLVDSSGVERPVGGASSGINYLADWFNGSKAIGTVATVAANGNITVAGSKPLTNSAWYADATSGAAAIASSSSTALRFSSNYLTALSGSSSSGATFVQTAAFTVDDSDLGKPVSISFDLTGVTTADDWDVVVARYTVSGTTGTYAELIPVAGTASSITGTPGAQLPTGTTQFRGFFVAGTTSTDVYALRFRRRTGTTQIRIDSLTVGPQSLAQGAVVTAWTEENITWNQDPGLSTTGSYVAPKIKWRRVGSSMEGFYDFRNGGSTAANNVQVSFRLPNNLTIDSTKFTALPASIATVGFARKGSAYEYINYYPTGAGTPSKSIYITGGLNAQLAADYLGGGWFSVPISEWSSGTTTLADRAVEEYAYNTDTTNANNTSSFGYGTDGALFPNRTVGTGVSKQVRFQTPILPTDRITLEYQQAGLGSWREASQIMSKITANAAIYGAYIDYVSSTDVTVQFAANGVTAFGAATYGANGEQWSAYNSAGWKWRVRKVSGGAAVGFPVSARNIVGDTSGTAVPAGYVGEQLVQSRLAASALALTSNTAANITATALTLTPGTWDLSGFIAISGSATAVTQIIGSISTTSATLGASDNAYIVDGVSRNLTTSDYQSAIPTYRVNISSSTTYYLVARAIFSGGGNTANAFGRIQATRVA